MSSTSGCTLTGDLPGTNTLSQNRNNYKSPYQNVLVSQTQVKTILKQQISHIQNTQTNLDLQNTTMGYGIHFQHRNPTTLPIEIPVCDSGRISEHAKYGYLKGSPNTNG
jgi:hypothetical protein